MKNSKGVNNNKNNNHNNNNSKVVNKLLTNIPTGDITELNELVYAGVKQICVGN